MSANTSPGGGGAEGLGPDETAVPGSSGAAPEIAEEADEFHDAADHLPLGSEDDDDDDDGDYHDAYTEEEDEDEEEDDDEDDDEDDEDEDEDEDDENPQVTYYTDGHLHMVLPSQTLRQVLTMYDPADDSDAESWGGWRKPPQEAGAPRFPKIPSEKGTALMNSGVFGAVERERGSCPAFLDMAQERSRTHMHVPARRRPVALRLLDREIGGAGYGDTWAGRRLNTEMIAQSLVPSTAADMVVRYDGPVYLGQFSDDGNFFYSGTKDLHVRLYDTSNVNAWRHYKTVSHPTGRWTLTDASLSPDNRWLAFTSMMPQVCLAPTDPNDEGDPYLLDLSRSRGGVGAGGEALGGGDGGGGHGLNMYGDSFCVFSVRFSGDGRELVTGTNTSAIVVYDIESRTVLHHLVGHEDDVNAVCFGDKASPHLLYSGSDDATIKVWDRRSLGDGRPAGAFVGHCEGITYLDSKGDGRYILSNGKDQTMRLWDLRMALSNADFQRRDPTQYTRYSRYDYRFQRYDDDRFFRHPDDNSVVTFRGHRVERTLLRCHFSPPGSSDGRYVYSASHSGKVYIWNLDATLAGVINVREAAYKTFAAVNAEAEEATVASASASASASAPSSRRQRPQQQQQQQQQQQRSTVFNDPLCVRDASWHPTAPVIVASSFDIENMENGYCSMHSADLTLPGEGDNKQHRLYDERMRPMLAIPPRRPMMRWWI